MQTVIEDGIKRTLKQFADEALAKLKGSPIGNEVCQLADNITELETDRMTPPRNIYPLPQGYSYRFSGAFGQVLGVIHQDYHHISPDPLKRDKRHCPRCNKDITFVIPLAQSCCRPCPDCGADTQFIGYFDS